MRGDARVRRQVCAWGAWCGPCRKSMPALQAWSTRSRTRPVRVITLDSKGEPLARARDSVEKFFRSQGLELPVLMADSTASARWQLGGFPMTFVLEDGRIVYRNHAGDLVAGLEAQLRHLGSRPAE
ncbi:MAG: TlpA disulfide reductase family protein [Candidatus Eisenbacteria bacterium]